MTEEIEQLLKNLRLRKIAEILDDELQNAERDQPTYHDFLLRLLRPQYHAKNEQALEWRIRRAQLPERWTLEGFPFKRHPGVSRRKVKTLAELDFIARAENVVFIGPTGVGKTGLACALMLKALQNGYRRQHLETVSDRHGRPTFEIYRFQSP